MIQHNPPTKLRGYERFPCYGSVSSSSDVAARPPAAAVGAAAVALLVIGAGIGAVAATARTGGGPPNVREAAPLTFAPRSRFNNSCLIDEFAPRSAGADAFDPCRFIVETTDEVWNTRKNVTEALHAYFVDDYIITSTSGTLARGMRELEKLVADSMRAFPDIKIQILDCFCVGDEDSGFKCSMPDLLSGTNLGVSRWGPATGRKVEYRGLVNSIIAKDGKGVWKYVEEFAVHDEWNLMTQLGVLNAPAPASQEGQEACEPIMKLKGRDSVDLAGEGQA